MVDNYEEKEITLADYLQVLGKRWKFIIGITIVATIISGIVALSLPKVYEAKAILRIGKSGDRLLESASTTKEIINSLYTLKQIVKQHNIEPTEQNAKLIESKIIIKDASTDDIMVIRARDSSPEGAKNLVTALCDMIIERHRSLYEKAEIDRRKYLQELTIQMGSLQKRTIGLGTVSISPTGIEIPATASEIPVAPNKKKIVSLVFILSLLSSTFMSFVIESFSQSLGKYKRVNP